MRKLVWILANVGMSVAAVFGLLRGVEASTNLLLFGTWSATVCAVLVMFSKDAQEEMRKRGPAVPRWMAVCNDAFLVVVLASVGRFFTAAGVLLQIMVEQAVYAPLESDEDAAQSKKQ